MRRVWLVIGLGLVGCGRLGFDPTTDADASDSGEPTFTSLCAFPKLTVVKNGITRDDQVGASIATALAAGCGVSPVMRTASQNDPGILDPLTDRPLLAPDDLAVLGGGDGPHRGLAYLLASDTPVTWTGSSPVTFRERATARTIITAPTSGSHDFALVMVIVEPIGGARILSASGMGTAGTEAAGFWFTNRIADGIRTNGDIWVLVEWTDVDNITGPSADDTFTVIDSG